MRSSCLTVLCAEPVALSNSSHSSGSNSLFSSAISSSDSQTDYSPPHSPLSTHGKSNPSTDISQDGFCSIPLLKSENTPRQKFCKRTPALLDLFDVSDDGGYESERESRKTSGHTSAIRSTRKSKLVPRFRSLRPVSLATLHGNLKEPLQDKPSIEISLVLPPKPRILPVINLDSPSPILLSSPIQRSDLRQPQPGLNLLMSLDDVALNSYTSTSSLKNNALNDQEDEDHRQANVNTSPTGTPKSRKSNGIGLGLPSVLCRSASSSSSQDSLSSSQSKDAEQHSKYHIPSVILRTPGQSLNRTTEPGIISGTRQFFRTCRFPERRLYDIPEHLSPKFNAKTFAFGRSSPRSVPGIIPVASSDFSRTKHVRPSLLEASVKPCLRLKTTSPVGVRDNAGQKVDSLCQRWMNSSQLVTLF